MRGKIVMCVLVCLSVGQAAVAQVCLRPIPPYVPEQVEDIRAYSDLLKQDMEAYFDDVQRYFRCIDTERGEVFAEAGRVTEEYGQVLDIVNDNSE
ncbi:hypothetical protein [Tritonibacter mobilis]|uniref:hypothetical protein n=1 Tax=Tritonibacter mobilis TaxID=379347 RepID=UPI001CDA44D4|nr:hypothetical protein [Tritonibacter mobilis]MCA2007079.1 hypothetical protein [Tritonibacter mobilis]